MFAGIDIATLISAVFAVAGGAVALYQKIKTGQAEAAYDQAQATLAAIAVAVETVPMSEAERGRLKKNIQWLATQMETEEAVLKPVVRQVTELAKSMVKNQQGERLTKETQAEALAVWKAAQVAKKNRKTKAPVVPILLFALVTLAAAGCQTGRNPALVQTAVIPGDAETPALVQVAWPAGISEDPEDFTTTKTTSGVMVTTAPLVGTSPNE